MPFSDSSGVVAITGTETIASLFSSSVNNPSGNSGTYLDRLTQSGGNTTNDWVAYSCKSPLRMAINSGTFTITGHTAISSDLDVGSGIPAVIAINGGTLNIGQSFTNPNNSTTVQRDWKTSLQFTDATPFDGYRTRHAAIYVTGSGSLNITGTKVYLSAYLHCVPGATVSLQNSEFLIDVAPNNDGNYYAGLFFPNENLTINNCRVVGRQGDAFFIVESTATLQDVVSEALNVGFGVDNGYSNIQTINLVRHNFVGCTFDVNPFQGLNGGHLVRLRNCLKVASTINVQNLANTSQSNRTGTLLAQGSLNRKVVDSSGSTLSGVTVWYRDTNNGSRNNNTNGSDTLSRAYGADQTATLTTNGTGDITETWLNCRIWHKPTQATVAVADDRGPFTIRYRNFAHLFEEEAITSDLLSVGSSSRIRLLTDANVSGTKSGAAALSGITLTHATRAISITGTITLQNIYNRYKSELIDTPATAEFLEFVAATNTLSFSAGSLTISSPSNISSGTVNLAGANLTLSAIGDYSGVSFRPTGVATITVAGGGTTNLQRSIGNGATINAPSAATVTVDNVSDWVAGSNVTLQVAPKTLTIQGFQPVSDVILSQAGRTITRLNETTPPFTWNITGITIPSAISLTILKSGYEIYTQTVQIIDSDQSITVAQVPSGATDSYNGNEFKFKSLMLADAGFKRILNAATGVLVDDAANCRLAQFESASVKASWNLLVAATVPTSLEISTWQGYLVSAGYSVISFANSTGVVS